MGSIVSDQRYVIVPAIKCRRFVRELIDEPDQPSASYSVCVCMMERIH